MVGIRAMIESNLCMRDSLLQKRRASSVDKSSDVTAFRHPWGPTLGGGRTLAAADQGAFELPARNQARRVPRDDGCRSCRGPNCAPSVTALSQTWQWPAGGLERMLRMCLCSTGSSLADEACEEALLDSTALRRFVGIDP